VARRRLHLIAPAGSARPFLDALGMKSAESLLELVSEAVGAGIEVTGDIRLIEAEEDETRGGRWDDVARANDITAALAEDEVGAILFVRGGAWFSRVLAHIDFSVLKRRTRPVAVLGFSEATTLVNVVGAHALGRGIYDIGPAFLTYGLRRHAVLGARFAAKEGPRPEDWMRARLRPECMAYLRDVAGMLNGLGTRRRLRAKLVAGDLPEGEGGTFVGGNLTVLSTLVGSRFDAAVRPLGRWLVLEDFNDKVERLDRFLSHLTLAGYWDECAGVLLGDFHRGYDDLTPAVLALLPYHLGGRRSLPILVTRDVGHVWPAAPLPLHTPLRFRRHSEDEIEIEAPAEAMGTAE
jgi:muramoyltetrapeptide carboxypeptidase